MKREKLINLLGTPPEPVQTSAEVVRCEEVDGFMLETWVLELNGIEKVPAYFAYPKNVGENTPLVLFNHSHGGDFEKGKREFLHSSNYLQQPSFAKAITDLGFCSACIDHWGFNERKGKKESELVKEMLLYGQTLWGMRLFDSMLFLDCLSGDKRVDSSRIATIGMSMGGLLSWWLAAIDERIKVCVDIAAQVDVETLIEHRGLDHHGFYYYVPGLLRHFSTCEIQSLISPRKRISISGRDDNMCPLPGVKKLDEYLKKTYTAAGVPENWRQYILTGGHQETAHARHIWTDYLKENL